MQWYAKYIGTPFKSAGRDLDGCDCYGLVRIILKDHYDIILPELLNYSDSLDKAEVSPVINENVPLLSGEELDKPVEGSVVVLANRGVESHVGLMVTDKLMLHTTSATGAVIEPISSNRIKNRIRGYYSVNQSYSSKTSI